MAISLDKIKEMAKLSASERIEKLKELKEKQEKELDEIEVLLKESVSDVVLEAQAIEEIESSIEDMVETIALPKEMVEKLREPQSAMYALGKKDVYSMLYNLHSQSEQGVEWSEEQKDSFDAIKNSLLYTALDYTGSAPDDVLDNIIASRRVLKLLGYKADWWKA